MLGTIEKIYDGNKNATLNSQNFESDKVEGDEVSFTAKAEYDTKNAGIEKEVTASQFVIAGEDATNYTLETETAKAYGTIFQKKITAKANAIPAITKVYDGTDDANLVQANYGLENTVEGDDVSVSGKANYENRHVGSDKQITIGKLELSGEDKNNYLLYTESMSTAGDITGKTLTVYF